MERTEYITVKDMSKSILSSEKVNNRLFKLDLIRGCASDYWFMITVFLGDEYNVVVQGNKREEPDYYFRWYTLPNETIQEIQSLIENNARIVEMHTDCLVFPLPDQNKKSQIDEQSIGYEHYSNKETLKTEIYKFYFRNVKPYNLSTCFEFQSCTIDYKPYDKKTEKYFELIIEISNEILLILKQNGIDLSEIDWNPKPQLSLNIL